MQDFSSRRRVGDAECALFKDGEPADPDLKPDIDLHVEAQVAARGHDRWLVAAPGQGDGAYPGSQPRL